MKHYWKLAVLVPFIVLCIGTYYTQASDGYPDYYLKTLTGNEQEASHIALEGRFENEAVSIGTKGSRYQSNPSFLETLSMNSPYNPEIGQLVKEHRQFMRGKTNLYALYEDEKTIAYVNTNQTYSSRRGSEQPFTVSLYDKQRKKDTSFDLKMPQQSAFDSINVLDAQIVGETLKLVTTNNIRSGTQGNTYPEVHLYTLDLNKKNVMNDQVIIPGVSPESNNWVALIPALETDLTKKSRYLVFQIVHSTQQQKTDPGTSYTVDNRELFVYDLESEKGETVGDDGMKAFVKGEHNPNMTHSGDELFLTSGANAEGLHVIRYSLSEQKIKKELSVAVKDLQLDSGKSGFTRIADNRLYMYISTVKSGVPSAPAIAIADLDTGGIVYQGVVARKDNKPLRNLMVDRIAIMK